MAIAARAGGPVSRVGADEPRRCHLAHLVVGLVGDVEIVVAVHQHIDRTVELGLRCLESVSARSGGAVPGHGGHDAVGGDSADLVVGGVGDVEVAHSVESEAADKTPEKRFSGRLSVSAGTSSAAGPRDSAQDALGGDLSDRGQVVLAEVQVSAAVHRQSHWGVNVPGRRLVPVGRRGGNPVARHRGDDSTGSDFPDDVAVLLGDVDVPRLVDGDPLGLPQHHGRCLSIVAGHMRSSSHGLDHVWNRRRLGEAESGSEKQGKRKSSGRGHRLSWVGVKSGFQTRSL